MNDPNFEICYEKHCWDAVKDFYNEYSVLEDGQEYKLLFELASDKSNWTGFANTIMGMLILKNKGRKRELGCKVDSSQDGENHFWMLKRKELETYNETADEKIVLTSETEIRYALAVCLLALIEEVEKYVRYEPDEPNYIRNTVDAREMYDMAFGIL